MEFGVAINRQGVPPNEEMALAILTAQEALAQFIEVPDEWEWTATKEAVNGTTSYWDVDVVSKCR